MRKTNRRKRSLVYLIIAIHYTRRQIWTNPILPLDRTFNYPAKFESFDESGHYEYDNVSLRFHASLVKF